MCAEVARPRGSVGCSQSRSLDLSVGGGWGGLADYTGRETEESEESGESGEVGRGEVRWEVRSG